MRNFKALAVGAAMTLVLVGCDKPDLKSDKGQYSYAIGYQVAKNMKSQGVEIDSKAFAAAVKDVMAGKDPALNENDMRDAMRKMAEGRREKDKQKSDENLKKSEEYLAANKAKDGVKTTASGLQYKVISEGKGKMPTDNSLVEVHYKGTLIDGTEFDSSYKRNSPAQFPVKGVIPGWTEALKLMKEGSKYELYIPPALGYGEQGNPSIPGNSALVFEVELLKIIK
jgi:FKBP-type peptidyl-prolyl cis-trans isomerase